MIFIRITKKQKIGTNETGESIINEKNYKKLTRFKLTSKNKNIFNRKNRVMKYK